MSLKGGYQIINLKNREFSTTSNNMEYYKDIFFNLLNSHAKMIIVSGLNMDGVKYNDYETIFYEVEQPDDNPYFQCIARRIWNTKDYKCITKYINIYHNDRVMCTQEEFTYEILPDGEMSLTSTNALQNKVITNNINRIDESIENLSNYIISDSSILFHNNGNPITEYNCRVSKTILDTFGNCTFYAWLHRDNMDEGALYANQIAFNLLEDDIVYYTISGLGIVHGVGTSNTDAQIDHNFVTLRCDVTESINGDIALCTTEYNTRFDMRLADSDYYIYGTFKIPSGVKIPSNN